MKNNIILLSILEQADIFDQNNDHIYSDFLYENTKLTFSKKYNRRIILSQSESNIRSQANEILYKIMFSYYSKIIGANETNRRLLPNAQDSIYAKIQKNDNAYNYIVKSIYRITDRNLRQVVYYLFHNKLEAKKVQPQEKKVEKVELKKTPDAQNSLHPQVYAKFFQIISDTLNNLNKSSNISEANKIFTNLKTTTIPQFKNFAQSFKDPKLTYHLPIETDKLEESMLTLIKTRIKTDKGWDLT